MKFRFKLLALLLALIFTLSVFVGCNTSESDESNLGAEATDSAPAEETTSDIAAAPSVYNLVENGVANVRVVRPANLKTDEMSVKVAIEIRKNINTVTDASPELGDDWLKDGQSHDSTTLEILVGATNYPETAEAIKDLTYGEYTVTDDTTGQSLTAGANGFLHEFIDLEAGFGYAPAKVTVRFDSGAVSIGEITAYSSGEVPSNVQKWSLPLDGGADILMLPTHGDDDQLYFAGLLPLYAGELGLRVQVVYMTDHHNVDKTRIHEMLNGLWEVGVTAYPIFGTYIDFRDDTISGTYQTYTNRGISKDDFIAFVTEQIRRFKPLVAIGHDINGEYGHGMHKVYSASLREAVAVSMDPNVYPESAEKWGTWDVPKTYLHLLEENPIVLDYDVPLESFDGLTAFQVTQKYGFPCHISQQGTMFTSWLYGSDRSITKATQITKYNPCNFGLYRTTIGPDVEKNDFMENLVCYAEQERLEAERLEQERLEAERLEQERLEAERLEQERLEAERLEQERLEQERLEAERLEAERLEAERLAQEQLEAALKADRRKLYIACGTLSLLMLSLIAVLVFLARTNRRKNFVKK